MKKTSISGHTETLITPAALYSVHPSRFAHPSRRVTSRKMDETAKYPANIKLENTAPSYRIDEYY